MKERDFQKFVFIDKRLISDDISQEKQIKEQSVRDEKRLKRIKLMKSIRELYLGVYDD